MLCGTEEGGCTSSLEATRAGASWASGTTLKYCSSAPFGCVRLAPLTDAADPAKELGLLQDTVERWRV